MEKKEMIYEGKAKQIFSTDQDDQVIVHFKDDATAFDLSLIHISEPTRPY